MRMPSATQLRRIALGAALLMACDDVRSHAQPPASARIPGPSRPAGANPVIPDVRRTPITEAVERVSPAVVTVQTAAVQRVPVDPFDYFFGGRSGERVIPGLGSGFIVRQDGVVVTNAHVVAGATRVSVALRDGTTYEAEVVGTDEVNDVAVLKIDATGLPVAPIGDSDALLVGEWVIAIGNPYGFVLGNTEPSVTTGVLSATGRNLLGAGEQAGAFVDMLQTDASINPGNSGGPLINAAGEVIGVNSSIYSPSGGSIGLGFAIPINRARRIAEDLLEHGAVRRPWVGLKIEVPQQLISREELRDGATVEMVVPNSPAAQAGVRPGDVIVRAATRPVRNGFDWEAQLLDVRVGDELPIRIRRDGRELSLRLRVADLPEVAAPKVSVGGELELVTLTPAIRAEQGVLSTAGAVVYKVSDRVRNQIGLREGDVIVQINRTRITSADQVSEAIEFYGRRGFIQMLVERNGRYYRTEFRI